MAEHHRATIDFVGWDDGYLPGYKGYRENPPAEPQGVWLRRRVRRRTILYRIGLEDPMSDAEAAAVLGVTRQTIRNWRLSGQLPARRRKGSWLFAYKDVRALQLARRGDERTIYLVN